MTAHVAHDLFSYPQAAGWKARDTSRQAAERLDAEIWQAKVLAEFERQRYMTADECAEALGADRYTIRPRVTELSKQQKIMDSGERRRNACSGRSAIVWKLV